MIQCTKGFSHANTDYFSTLMYWQALADYRPIVLFNLSSLTQLDSRKVDVKEKVSDVLHLCEQALHTDTHVHVHTRTHRLLLRIDLLHLLRLWLHKTIE